MLPRDGGSLSFASVAGVALRHIPLLLVLISNDVYVADATDVVMFGNSCKSFSPAQAQYCVFVLVAARPGENSPRRFIVHSAMRNLPILPTSPPRRHRIQQPGQPAEGLAGCRRRRLCIRGRRFSRREDDLIPRRRVRQGWERPEGQAHVR